MKTKFTKGEWIIDYGHTIGHIKAVMDGRQSTPTVAIYNNKSRMLQRDPSDEEIANAKLIAAAPELLHHLIKCVEAIELIGIETGQSMPLTVADARAAIKKAIE